MVKKKLVQVTFKGDAVDRLEELRKAYGAITTSELIRDGIKVLAALQNLKEADGTITVSKGNRNYRIVLT